MKRDDPPLLAHHAKGLDRKENRTESIKDEEAIIESKGRHQHFIRTTPIFGRSGIQSSIKLVRIGR
jgi:hypothetical protein